MRRIRITQARIDVEHEGELFRLGGEVISKNSFVAWLSLTECFPNEQAASEYDQAREKYVAGELSRLYGDLPRKDLPPNESADLFRTITRLYQDKKKILSKQEQLRIMHLVCEHWNDDNFTIYFTDDNLKELCNTKRQINLQMITREQRELEKRDNGGNNLNLNKMLCTLGKFDIPIIQLQPSFVVDLLDSNIALFGSAMSGKTTFVKTLVNILHKQFNENQEQVFILDFGGALSDYKSMPLVSAYFDNSNEEYVKRVFKILDNILKDNIKELNGKNYRESGVQPLHTTFIIDNLNAFIDEPRYAAYHEKLAKLCRDGLSKGITLVVTAVDTKGITSYLGGFKQKIAFEMPQDKYMDIFTGKVGMIGNNPGHGFANVTVRPEGVTGTFRMNLPYEVQCTLPFRSEYADGDADAQDAFIEKLKQKFGYLENKYTKCVKKYQTFPKELTKEEFDKLKQQPEDKDTNSKSTVSVGLDYVDFYPVKVDLEKSHVVAIYGKKEFGKTNLLNLLVSGFVKQEKDVRIVLFDDGRNQLKPIYENVNSSADCVMINKFDEVELCLNDGEKNIKKLSPLQQFYVYLNENYITLDKRFMAGIYGVNKELSREYNRVPDCKESPTPFTIFVIQSKLVYLNTNENKYFINTLLPQLVAVAQERGFLFIFSDVQKISDGEQNSFFNNVVSTTFLLDNIAEFAGERGQKTIFGNMDVKSLKEDYARCERGDGYFYDVEADNLLKLKFIKY